MKTAPAITFRRRRAQGGSAVLIILVLLAIMLILSQADSLSLRRLRLEVKASEKKQIQRLASNTNSVDTHPRATP